MEKKSLSKTGFSLIELMVVIGIAAFLLASVGLSVYFSRRNNLVTEQVAQELSSEIRLVQSRILGIQNIMDSAGTAHTPKAAVIRLRPGYDVDIRYIEKVAGNCVNMPASTQETFNIMPRASILSTTAGGTSYPDIYFVSITPTGRFYSLSSIGAFQPGPNNSCVPTGSVVSGQTIKVTISNGSRDYYIKIDSDNGAITPTPTP